MPRVRVRFQLIIVLIIVALEGFASLIDSHFGPTLPTDYLYVLPVLVGGLYLGYAGGIGAPALSIVAFHVEQKALPHRAYAEGDFLLLVMLVLVGTVTARIQADRLRARQYGRQLERLNRTREELTALIVHDLRTPLAGVLNVLRLIEEENESHLPDSDRELLGLALATGEDMTGMISDLLSLHAMESGALRMYEAETKLATTIGAAVRQVEPIARQRRVQIHTDLPEGLPAIHCDEAMIRRVLVNLLGNALRFSPRDSTINIEVKRMGAEMVVSVGDEGPGIPDHLKERVFDKFASVDAEAGKHIATGLGLAFARMAVQAHGGRIWVDSPWTSPKGDQPARGSRFSFTLPLGPRSHTGPTALQP